MKRYFSGSRKQDRLWSATTVLAIMLALSGLTFAQEKQLRITAEEASRISQSEEQLKQLIQAELARANPLFQGRKATSLSGRQAVMKGLEKNLSLRRGRLSDTIAAAALQEARAVFDPVLLLSLGYERSQTNDRIESAKRYQSSTTVNENGENVLEVDQALDPRAPIVVFTEPRNEGFFDSEVIASQESITGDDERLSLGAGLEQLLPWGGSLLISYTAINQDRFFINNGQFYSGSTDPELRDLVSFGSYKRPWVSELVAGMQTPLPGMKDFGSFSTPTLNRSRAILARESAAYDIKSVTNQTLLQVDAAYWAMVESALTAQAVRESLNAAEDMYDSTQRLYNGRSANNYDLAQAELTLADTRTREQQAWSDYLRASDTLVFLLDMPASSLIVPNGFSELIALDESPAPTVTDAVVKHPDYQSAKAQSESANLGSQAGRQGLRPDLTLDAELQLRQSNQVFGYKSFGDSLGSVFDPDISTQRLGLNYTLPLGQRGLKATSRASEAAYKQATLQLAATGNELQGRQSGARARLEGARINAVYAAEANQLAEVSYEKALERQRSREVREFELSGQHARLLDARLAYISSLVEVKRAETALLEAQGVLHEKYADRLTRSNVERLRLSRLQDSGAFSIFLPGGKDL